MDFMDQRGRKVYLNVELGRGIKPAVGGKIFTCQLLSRTFMMSTKGYGCSFILRLLPNGIWDGTVVTIIHSKSFGGDLDYYFIYGPIFIPWLTDIRN